VNAQTLGDGQHDLPMGDRRADFLGGHQSAAMVGAARSATSASGGRRDRWHFDPGNDSAANPQRASVEHAEAFGADVVICSVTLAETRHLLQTDRLESARR